MEPLDVRSYLRRCGVVVHHAARMPATLDGRQSIVVFLEGNLGQFELARECALRLPGVIEVSFSGYSRAIMYVAWTEPLLSREVRAVRARPPRGPGPSPEAARHRPSGRPRSRPAELGPEPPG
jgi:hypothetical protein